MIWTGLTCLNYFIGSVVWNNNVINWVPIWCDISTKFMIGAAVAIPAASLCINRRLYYIASVQSATVTRAEKRRAVLTDLAIGLGIPFVEMVLHIIVQGHRFNIYEEVGCFPATFNTPPAYVLVYAWPLVIGCVSATYCILTIRAFAQRRSQFKQLLSANSNLNSSRYFRLMALAGIELLCTVPLGSYSIYLNASTTPSPYVSWANAHWHFERVDQYPAILWKLSRNGVISLELSRWLVILCAFIFFGFFGFADEARKHYRLAFDSVAKRVGYSTASMNSQFSTNSKSQNTSIGSRSLPVFVTKHTSEKRDSIASFDNLTNFTVSVADYGAFDDVKEVPYTPTASSASTSSGSSLPPSPDDEYATHEFPPPPALSPPERALDPSDILPPTRPPHTDSAV